MLPSVPWSAPSVPAIIPSPEQQAAFDFMRGGGTKFANPLTDQVAEAEAAVANIGGVQVQQLEQMLAAGVANGTASVPDPNTPIITQADYDLIMNDLGRIGLDGVTGAGAGAASATAKIAEQTSKVVCGEDGNQMQKTLSAVSAHANTAEMFGDSSSICNGVGDLLGSLAGGASGFFDGIGAAVSEVNTMFNSVATAVKTAFNTAISDFADLFNTIGSDITTALVALKTQVTTFVDDAAADITAATGLVMSEIKTAVGGALSAIGETFGDLTGAIQSELSKLEGVYDYLKDAAIAMNFPSLNPCSKDVVKNVCGAAGADPLVKLVS